MDSPNHQSSSAAAGGAAFPTHQKNPTWDAFMWSSKLQLPSLGDPLTTDHSSHPIPTHRRGASMPPNLDDDDNGLPPIRYDDFVSGRPRLGHRTRGTMGSLGAASDWTHSSGGSLDLTAELGKKDDILIAEPPPTHRRGGSIPMGNTLTLGGLDLFGADALLGSSLSGASSTSAPNSARPQHRRSVTFQGTTSTFSSDLLFDMDSLKQGLDSSKPITVASTPPRMSTPPPPQSSQNIHQPTAMQAAQQNNSLGLPQPPAGPSTPMAMPPMMAPTNASPMMPAHYMYPPMYHQAQADHMGGYHHDYMNGAGGDRMHGGGGGPAIDPAMQLQIQMQQALLVQQQQWLLAMQQQQLQQQRVVRQHPQQQQQQPQQLQQQQQQHYYSNSPPMHGQQSNSPSPPMMMIPPASNSPVLGGSNSPIMRYHGKSHHHHVGNSGGGNNSNSGAVPPPLTPGASSSSTSSDPVLSEYKSTGLRPKIEDLKGHVMAFATDAHGSRFLQYQMEIARAEDKDMLVSESLDSAVQLMQDTFGNYVIQNFLEHATPASRRLLAETMKGSMLQLSIQPHGCRVVQRALDLVDIDQRNELLHELLVPKGNVFTAARNTHATHVLQKTVSILRRDSALEAGGNDRLRGSVDLMRAMEKAVADDVVPLLLHPHAYRLVLNVLSDCDPTRSVHVQRAVETIAANRDQLCVDQHGNFMLQHMLDNKQADGVLDFVQDRLIELSQHKFGSHLVEKCFAVASPERCARLVEEILRPASDRNIVATKRLKAQQGDGPEWSVGESPALALMKDPYANFVVQKAFDRIHPSPLKTELMNLVQDNAELLQKFTYGRHILAHVMAARQAQQLPGGQQQVSTGSYPPHQNGSTSPGRNGMAGSPYTAPKAFYPRGQGGRGGAQVRG